MLILDMKHSITTLLICACALSIHGETTFHKLIDMGQPVARFMSVLPTDSCYYAIGTFTDSLFKAGAMWAKIDLDGGLTAQSSNRHPDRDIFNDYGDLRSTPDGLLFNAGSFNEFPSTQVIFYLYSQDGDTLLTRRYKSILYPLVDFVVPINVIQKEDSGYAIACVHDTNDSPTNSDISLLLIDTAFQIEGYFSYAHTTKHETPGSLLLDGDGGYIIGAERTNDGQTYTNYDNRTLIIKTNSTGAQAWQWLSPAGVLQDEAKSIIKTTDGGLVVASGKGNEIGNNPNIHTLVWDGLIFKLDADRNVVWSTPLRGDIPTGDTELTEMVEATDGSGFVASGIILEYISDVEFHRTSWLVKVSPEGDSLWARRYTYFDGDFVAPEVYDMKATTDGGYVLVGFSRNVGLPAPAWIMKVDSFGCLIPGCHLPNSITEEGEPEIQLSIYPNPASDFLNFYLRVSAPSKGAMFRIVDSNGQVVKEMKTENLNSTYMIPIHNWANGAYWLQYLENGRVVHSEKFIKQ